MIVTLTPNPSLDWTVEVPALVRGTVIRATEGPVDAGGKGVNVARALAANGHPVRAVLPSGGTDGERLQAVLAGIGLAVVAVPIATPTRRNLTLVEPDGTVTKVNVPGPTFTADDVAAVTKATVTALDEGGWLAACGSLPPGFPADYYAAVTADARAQRVRVAVDTSGAALAASVVARPDLLKPNADELAELSAMPLATLGDVVASAEALLERGVGAVLVSLGPDGAVLVDERGAVHASSPPVTARSTVGAGDATLAGFLFAGGSGPEALRTAVAWGTATVQLPGSAMPGPSDVDADLVDLSEVERSRRLSL
jgi:1-phosphofructokinase